MSSLREFFTSFQGIVTLILFAACVPLVGLGVYSAITAQQQLNTFERVRGTVVDNSYVTTENDEVTSGAYYPVVEFTPIDGRRTRFTDEVGTLPPDYQVGDQVDVLYNPKNLKEARINTWGRLWLLPTLMTGVGILPIIVFGSWWWWLAMRRKSDTRRSSPRGLR